MICHPLLKRAYRWEQVAIILLGNGGYLAANLKEATSAPGQRPVDIKEKYRSANILKNRRVVFNIRGNDYRLIVAVAYRFQAVYVNFIGTHAQYNAIDAETIELET